MIFGIPCKWYNMENTWASRLPYMIASIALVLSYWCCFGYEMYIVKVYWRGEQKPREPTDALVVMVLLFLSGTITFTLAIYYFYNPKSKFVGHFTKLVPKVKFQPDGIQQDIGPSEKDWVYTYRFFLLGTTTVAMTALGDFYFNAFFNFYGIHDFVKRLSPVGQIIDFAIIGIIYWGLIGSVVFCCIFFVVCRDIIRHIEYTEELVLQEATDFRSGRKYYECLLKYTEKLLSSLKLWFTVHTLIFAFIVFAAVTELVSSLQSSNVDFKLILFSQIAGSLLIAFKFSFPFAAASRVTTRFDKMIQVFNEQLHSQDFPESDSFLSYCKRCEGGFKVLGIRITMSIAFATFISSFLGFLKFHKEFF